MKVLHICNNFISSTVHQKMAQASRKLGIRNVVFAPVVTLEGRVVPGEDEHAVACVNKWDRFFFYHKQRKTYRALKQAVPQQQFCLTHTHCVFTDGNAALWLKEELGIPFLVTVNNTDMNHFFRLRRFLRGRGIRILRQASAIVFISPAYRDQLFFRYIPQKYHAELLAKSHIIPFGIDDFWLENRNLQPKQLADSKTLRLVYAGDVCENKNLLTTVQAMELLRQKGWTVTFTFAGKILSQAVYDRVMAAEGVSYAGLLTKEELLQLYRAHDVFVMPSFKDTFGLVYAEALSQGLPILYSKGQGFDMQLPEGSVGYRVDPRDANDLALAMERVAAHYSELQPRCAEAATTFSWGAVAKQYQSLYQSMTAGEGTL